MADRRGSTGDHCNGQLCASAPTDAVCGASVWRCVAVCFLTYPKEETETMDELGYSNANVWYVSDQKCDLLGNSGDASIYPGTFHLYELSNTKMFCFDSGWGGRRYRTYMESLFFKMGW